MLAQCVRSRRTRRETLGASNVVMWPLLTFLSNCVHSTKTSVLALNDWLAARNPIRFKPNLSCDMTSMTWNAAQFMSWPNMLSCGQSTQEVDVYKAEVRLRQRIH